MEGPTDIIFIGNDLYITENLGYKISKLENVILGINDLSYKEIVLYPNPSSDFISLTNSIQPIDYSIFNNIGMEISKGILIQNEKIDISHLNSGLYFLKFENGNTLKFIKK